jgi:hypothetical protein
MKLTPPKMLTWVIAFVLAVVGILMYIGTFTFAFLAPYTFWLVVVAYALLAIGTMFKGI